MSARISGVKNFVSKAVSLFRGLPFSQVQSQSEKGAIFSFFAGIVDSLGGSATETAGLTLVVAGAGSDFTGTEVAASGWAGPGSAGPGSADAGWGLAARVFSSALSCSMPAFMTASSLAISSVSSGSGLAGGRAAAGAVLLVAFVSAGKGSCRAATFGGASG